MNWTPVLQLLQLGTNVALGLLTAEGLIPSQLAALATGIEGAVVPFLSALQGNEPAPDVIMSGYTTLLNTLSALEADTSLPASTLSKVMEYIAATQDGTTAFLAAAKGYDPSLYPVQGQIASE